MKKTFIVLIENEKYLSAIMKKMGWVEVDRVASGGMMSSNHLMITFEGDEKDWRDDYYAITQKNNNGYCLYFSLSMTDGFFTNSFDEFIKVSQSKKEKEQFEIFELPKTQQP